MATFVAIGGDADRNAVSGPIYFLGHGIPVAAAVCQSSNEWLLLDRINTWRDLNGLPALAASPTLTSAARHQAESMAQYGYFPDDYSVQFEGPDHNQIITWQQNIANAGYPDNTHTVRAAIIGTGVPSVSAIAKTLINLPAYRSVIADSRYRAIGVGFAIETSDPGTVVWTITLGSLLDNQAETCADVPALLPVASASASKGSMKGALAVDGSLETVWSTSGDTIPADATITLDLGSVLQLSRIEWLFSQGGAADSFLIQVSSDKSNWTDVAVKTNGAVGEWRAQEWTGLARYVRFTFVNPNSDPVLGYLAEIRVFG